MKTQLAKTTTLFLIILVYGIRTVYAQSQEEKPGLGRGTINSQFNYVIYQSDKQEDVRIVKSWWLYRLKKEVDDTLQLKNTEIQSLKKTIIDKNTVIDSLRLTIQSTNTTLKKTTKAKDSISLFGISIFKTLYKSIVWGAILILAGVMVIFILLYNRSQLITKRIHRTLNETNEEFEAFRKRALEREQEVVRDLYEELKKYKKEAGE